VPCTFQVVASLSVPVLLGCEIVNAHAHAILPSDQAVRWRDGTASAIFRGLNDKIDRRASACCVLRLAYKMQLAQRSATVAWVRTPWGGLGQVFGASRLMTMHRATVANGVHEILPDIAFPVVLSTFGACKVTLCPKTAVGRVEVLTTCVIALPSPADAGRDGPTRVEVSADDPSFCAARSPSGGGRASPAPSAGDPTEMLLSNQAGEGPPTEGHIPAEKPEATGEGPRTEGHTLAGTPGALDTGPPRVADVPLPEAAPHLHERIRAVLHKHEAMWSGQALGATKATRHHIELTLGAKPVRVPLQRAGPKARAAEAAEIECQLTAAVIEPTSFEWGFFVVLVHKKDGTLRFCVDYRLLNEFFKRDSYPLPRMDECIDSLGEAKVFSTLDCNAGYWQVLIADGDREKTAFVCHKGAYHYKRMPFVLTNAPATFQRALDIILSGVKWQSCLVYLDDVIVYSKTQEVHFQHLDDILGLLRAAGVTLKLPKCRFSRTPVEYLGHEITPGRLGVLQAQTKALREAAFPTTRTQVRSFIGMCNVFRRFVPNFARVATPLTDLMGSTAPVTVALPTPEQLFAFEELKGRLTQPPVLALPLASLQYVLDVDACGTQVGAALLQEQEEGGLRHGGLHEPRPRRGQTELRRDRKGVPRRRVGLPQVASLPGGGPGFGPDGSRLPPLASKH